MADIRTGEKDGRRCCLPGIAAGYKVAILSLSADQSVQFHAVHYKKSASSLLFAIFFVLYALWYFTRDWILSRRGY